MTRALRCGLTAVCLGFLAFLPDSASAQAPDSRTPGPMRQEAQDTSTGRVSPRGAFLRSAVIPGWGHAATGAYARGAFYFAVESATTFMIFKTQSRLAVATRQRKLVEDIIRSDLEAQGVVDPAEVEDAFEDDERWADLRGLEDARGDQREDWLALGIFFLFLGGADAFVSAHLADFPAPVEVEVTGSPTGHMEVALSLPVGF